MESGKYAKGSSKPRQKDISKDYEDYLFKRIKIKRKIKVVVD